jgi:uncharacterized protein
MRIAKLYCYPVKGLSPQALETAELATDGYFPDDRLFALENGPSGFDPLNPVHQPKIKFVMLMRNAALAGLKTHYDAASGILGVARDGREVARGDLRTREGRGRIEDFVTGFLGGEIRGPVRLLEAPENFRFTDSKLGYVSLVNLASVAAIGDSLDPLRFRANVYLEDLPAWDEMKLIGKTLSLGGARLEILKNTDRCAATGVDPDTGVRDIDVVQKLSAAFGHVDCGVYARVLRGGRIARGDSAIPVD